MPSRRERRARVWLLAAGAVLAVLALMLVIGLVSQLVLLLDPDRPARELALHYARSAAAMDMGQAWEDYSPCFQRRHPKAEWVAEGTRTDGVTHVPAPADTRYHVVGVRNQGIYKRVEVRVEPPGFVTLDYEIDVRMYAGRWVVVGIGSLGHTVHDDCVRGGGS